MTMFFTLNVTPTNYVGNMMLMWQTMVKAGWLVVSWSDGNVAGGTVNGSPGLGFLGFRTGADGLPIHVASVTGSANNDRAWILLQQPAPVSASAAPYSGRRQLSFQRSTASRFQWRIKYSVGGGYDPNPSTTGTLVQVPGINVSIADEVLLRGGGTDPSPTFADVYDSAAPAVEGTLRCQSMADDGTTGSLNPYGFLSFGYAQGGGATLSHGFLFDPLVFGSVPSGTLDPFVIYIGSTNGRVFRKSSEFDTFQSENNSSASPQAWLRYGQSDGTFTQFGACTWCAYDNSSSNTSTRMTIVPSSLGGNAYTTYEDLFPIMYMREGSIGTAGGFKGVSSFMRWCGNNHQTGETLSVIDPATTRDRIVTDEANVPWDGSTIPLI